MSDDELKKLFGALREDVTAIREGYDAAHAETCREFRAHAELDRRVRTLEENQRSLEESVTDLQSRVDRLEGSTH